MPRVSFGAAGQLMKQREMLVDMISSTEDWMSESVIRLMCPFDTSHAQIWSGLLLRVRQARARGRRAPKGG